MVVQNNYSALAVLAIVILGGAVVLGFLLTPTEVFNPSQARQIAVAKSTDSALSVRERSGILQATETPRAHLVVVQQTQTASAVNATQTHIAAIAQATAIPVQQTVAHATLQAELNVSQVRATQTALAVEAQNKVLQAQATQTRVAQEQAANAHSAQATATSIAVASARDHDERNNANTREMALTATMTIAIIAAAASGATLIVANAKAKASTAAAMLEREKRRTLEVQAALHTARMADKNIIPLPSARGPKNGHGAQEKIAA